MPRPDDRSPPPSLDALEAKIAAIRARRAPPPPGMASRGFKGVELAWRMVIDLAAGIAVGLTIGWGIDALAGTQPLFMIVFVLLGFASGVRIMLQSAKAAQAKSNAGPGPAPKAGDGASAPQRTSGAEAPEREDG
ncbi:MAG: AtpZ/AtpI family protein [Pseudomonadota bacterium]